MRSLDWIVLVSSLTFAVAFGIWKGRGSKNIKSYLLSNYDMKWYTITLSVMATQASAITFLSTPGQAYVDGMRFIQFYFGLPLAMIILSITAVPIYHRLKVYTAYEYLEKKFDLKTRALAAFLFLIQRGLAAGLTIYAPSIILSVLFGWNLHITIIVIGGLVIIYTASGGSKAVGWTQSYNMLIIFLGIGTAFFIMLYLLGNHISFLDSIKVAGKMGKLNAIDFSFDLNNRYNIWSGLIGGLFLQLSYFGTDQSQVQRYLTGENIAQSRIGLLVNGIVKVPMQFIILFIGAMLFVFYQFIQPPLFFDPVATKNIKKSIHAEKYEALENEHKKVFEEKRTDLNNLVSSMNSDDESETKYSEKRIDESELKLNNIRNEAVNLIQKENPRANPNDVNYVFLTFVINFLPAGLIGLVLAAIFAASMNSTSAEINALASTTIVDIYKRTIKSEASDKHYLVFSKIATIFWGLFAILFAEFATRIGSLVEAVNILGSIFYGTILGIFLLAFYFKRIKGTSVFFAAIIAEIAVVFCFIFTGISFLWYNVIGCLLVIFIAIIINSFLNRRKISVQ